MNRYALLVAALAMLSLAGCDRSPSTHALSGTVTYREKITLDPLSDITVRLHDTGAGNNPTGFIGEYREQAGPKGPPYPFTITLNVRAPYV